MGKVYNVVLNSALGTVVSAFNQYTFFYNWGQLPEGRYKVTFSFMSSAGTLLNTSVCNVFMDLGQKYINFGNNSSNSSVINYTRQYLGMLRYSATGANSYLFAEENMNPPIYLNNRPTNNNIDVFMRNSNATQSAYSFTTAPANYTLVLNFELLDD
jgi:hypothetical protein